MRWPIQANNGLITDGHAPISLRVIAQARVHYLPTSGGASNQRTAAQVCAPTRNTSTPGGWVSVLRCTGFQHTVSPEPSFPGKPGACSRTGPRGAVWGLAEHILGYRAPDLDLAAGPRVGLLGLAKTCEIYHSQTCGIRMWAVESECGVWNQNI